MSRGAIKESHLQLLNYNALDCTINYQVMEEFWRELFENDHENTYERTVQLYEPLMFMMTRGIRVDQERLRASHRQAEAMIEEKETELNKIVGYPLNANSPKQVMGHFYIKLGIPAYTNQEGKPTSDDMAMARLAKGTANRRPLREAKLIQEIRGLRKLVGTYLEITFDEDGRFRTSCNPRGTKWGRISTSKTIYDTGMNMQNLPPAFKDFLVPDPGYLMLEMDKARAEWVVVAYWAGDSEMMRVCESGVDPHAHTAHLMFKAPIELILADDKLLKHSTDPMVIRELRERELPEIYDLPFVPRIFSMRQGGKKSNHALNYDESYKRFALENEMTEKESKVLVEMYHEIYPGIRDNYDFVKEQLSKDRTMTNCFGRKIRLMDKWGPDLFKAAYSSVPQSTVADLVNNSIIEIYYDNNDLMQHIEFLAQVHDSILFQVPLWLPTSDILYIISRCETYMDPEMEYHHRSFHIDTDIKLGITSWATLQEMSLKDKPALGRRIDELKEAAGGLGN